ncbi:MAG: FKBP-type peptidyl-prolyl cis-trans isomerase [Alphaproteobacteria bacterium]|jgi:trigger factor|nr:FKBP-type peptidyl-prolyl cis-trans isomerase [Alphaproteobacteria bacterium]
MKKMAAIMGVCSMLGLAACDGADVAKNGDTVVINFAGFLDGVQFPGGTAENFPLTLGSGQFVPGFEEQVVGMAKGEERDINITFPTQYVPDLAGKDVVFKVKVVDILEK